MTMAGNSSNLIMGLGEACCGCFACRAACSLSCIEAKEDERGFMRPYVDGLRCVGCGKCDSVCPVLNSSVGLLAGSLVDPPMGLLAGGCICALWARSADDLLVSRSSSGGVFGEMARSVVDAGGVVYGAAFSNACRSVEHVRATSRTELEAVLRSKYLQSDVSALIYHQVKQDVASGRAVLFSGTPCQVSGMRRFLGSLGQQGNYLGVDIICHGVPSPRLWSSYLEHLSRCVGFDVREVSFRDKSTGWESCSLCVRGDDGSSWRELASENWYMKAFLENASLRPACFQCNFKLASGSDVTLGDFWGIRSAHENVSCEGGASAVVVHTEKGWEMVRRLSASSDGRCGVIQGESSLARVFEGNPSLAECANPHRNCKAFQLAAASKMPIELVMAAWPFGVYGSSKARTLFARGFFIARCVLRERFAAVRAFLRVPSSSS